MMKFRARLEARSLKIFFQKKTIITKFPTPPPPPSPHRRHQIKYFSVTNFRNIESISYVKFPYGMLCYDWFPYGMQFRYSVHTWEYTDMGKWSRIFNTASSSLKPDPD